MSRHRLTPQNAAASAVTNGKVIGGSLTVIQGSAVVYGFKVTDDKNLVYSVIVDAGNGKVLYTSPGQSMNLHPFQNHRGHCSRGGHTSWNPQQNPSSTTSPSSGNANPTTGETNTTIESQV